MCLGRLFLMLCNVHVAKPMKSFQTAAGGAKKELDPASLEEGGLQASDTAATAAGSMAQPCTHCESMRYASNYGPKTERSASMAATTTNLAAGRLTAPPSSQMM